MQLLYQTLGHSGFLLMSLSSLRMGLMYFKLRTNLNSDLGWSSLSAELCS